MPIAQLNIEGRYPKYTWGSKPSANSVSAGTRVTITGWTAPDSDWVSDGTYWRPVNGRAVVHAPVLVNAQAQSASLALVASVPGWTVPSDIAITPGMRIFVSLHVGVDNPSSAQDRLIDVGPSALTSLCATIKYTSTLNTIRVSDSTSRLSSGHWAALAGKNLGPTTNANAILVTAADLIASPISMYYQGGNPDGSEILNIHNFSISVGVS
jgi:hypothetical protein